MKQLLLLILIPFFSTVTFAQKRLVIIDNNDGYEVKRVDLTKVFTYRLKNTTAWRNGFVTSLGKDTVRLNTGTYSLKNFDYIRQNRKMGGFYSTAGDVALYGAFTAIGLAITFYIIEHEDNKYNYGDGKYPVTTATLIVAGSLGVIGGGLKLLTGKKNIPLGSRFTLVIQ